MAQPLISNPGEGEVMHAGPTETIVRVPGSASDGRLGAVELHLPAGWEGPPAHTHERVEHLWYVIDGDVVLTVGDVRATHSAGACIYVPAGVPHAFSTDGAGPAVVLQVDTPESLDDYFRELVLAFPPGRPVDPVQVADIMRRHDTRPLMEGR